MKDLGTVEFPFMETLWREKQSNSIELIRMAANSGPVCVYHSGGKDSIVLEELTKMAGVPHRSIYHVTTLDPPELVRFVRTCNVEMKHPGTNFIRLVEQKGLPTRWHRWCCDVLKHGKREMGVSFIGVRADESPARKKWKTISSCDTGWIVCPILTWSHDDIWRFIRERSMPYCSLYDQGWKRIGCIGCPLTGCPNKELSLYPRIKEAIRKAFFRWQDSHPFDGGQTTQRAWETWLEEGKLISRKDIPDPDEECQMKYLMV